MKSFIRVLVLTFSAIGMLLMAPGLARAGTDELIPFTAVLTGGQEVPSNASNAFGVAFMTFDERTDMLNFSLTYTDERLSGTEVSAHFHAPAVPGMTAPVVFGLVNPGSFSIGSPKFGSVGPFSAEQKEDLLKGLYYINVHTTVFPAGEIRGQVLPVGSGLDYGVEEPAELE